MSKLMRFSSMLEQESKRSTMQIQAALFNKIRELIPNPKELPKILQDLLSISADSSYRRLRGETALSVDEAFKLSRHFKIALSDLENFRNDHVIFEKRPFISSHQDFEAFMHRSLEHLEMVRNDPNHVFIHMSKDLPAFYQYKYRELAAFKLYVWMRSVYDIEKIDGEYINLSSIPEVLLELAKKQWETYNQINAIEIWNETTVVSLFNQIEYCYEAGLLRDKQEALLLCGQVAEMLKVIYRQAVHGKRMSQVNNEIPGEVDYKLYYNEVMIMDNHIIAKANNRLFYGIPYGVVNYLTTTNTEMTADMYNYMMRQVRKSALLSDASEKDRNKFFIRLRNRVDGLRQRIESSNPFVI